MTDMLPIVEIKSNNDPFIRLGEFWLKHVVCKRRVAKGSRNIDEELQSFLQNESSRYVSKRFTTFYSLITSSLS